MKLLLALFGLAMTTKAVSISVLEREEWNLFKQTYNKSYTSDTEDNFRLKVFLDNKLLIAKHNAEYAKGLVSYEVEMNKFGDMLQHEFVSTMLGLKMPNRTEGMGMRPKHTRLFIGPDNVDRGLSVDYRTKGAVTPVKDQGYCTSCWAFSATGALEGHNFLKTGRLVSLSEQNLLDCLGGSNACHKGNYPDKAFKYVIDNRGIDTEDAYPYEAKEKRRCRYDPRKSGATASSFYSIPRGNELKLQWALIYSGPVSVNIDASHPTFRIYNGSLHIVLAINLSQSIVSYQ